MSKKIDAGTAGLYSFKPKSPAPGNGLAAPEPLANTDAANPPEAIEDKLNDFLDTLKIHNKDLDACFNDALAVRHLKNLITTETTKARIDEWAQLRVIDWCNLRAPEVRRLRDDRINALQKEQK